MVSAYESYGPYTIEVEARKKARDKDQSKIKAIEYRNKVTQLKHEISLLRQVREMKRQRESMEKSLRFAQRCVALLNKGYIPTEAVERYWGILSPRMGGHKAHIFQRALPAPVIAALVKAKLDGFDLITIHCDSSEVFQDGFGMLSNSSGSPVLVGWVGAHLASEGSSMGGTRQGFIIAAFDIQRDLLAQGLILPEKAASLVHKEA